MSDKFFVSSDIHSAYTPWMESLNEAGFDIDNPNHKIVICGDLFDRLDETVQCFEFVKNLGDRAVYVKGNHESLLFDCVNEIRQGVVPNSHHFHNGTVKTICQFCGENEWIMYDPTWRDKICDIMQPILDWIDEKCLDYAEIGDYVFVHGWIPCNHGAENFRLAWSGDWERARWENGMDKWKYPQNRVDGKTIVCGHWHCSYGWSHIRQQLPEFPQKNKKNWLKSFEPFIDNGIAAIDSCVAYTGKVNVLVLEGEVWK